MIVNQRTVATPRGESFARLAEWLRRAHATIEWIIVGGSVIQDILDRDLKGAVSSRVRPLRLMLVN
ncbi:MAG: hypothetical protein ACREOK_15015 [Gemmatimonadaceae bacterium]